MSIESKRLILKDITWDDLDNIHKLHSYPEVDEFNTLGIPKDIEVTKELIRPIINNLTSAQKIQYGWVVVIKESDTFIGVAGMKLSADRFKSGEIFYNLAPNYWGNG